MQAETISILTDKQLVVEYEVTGCRLVNICSICYVFNGHSHNYTLVKFSTHAGHLKIINLLHVDRAASK